MAVIAMTREMGSLGKEVAEQVARQLGLRPVYDEILESLASRMGYARTRIARLIEGRASLLERWRNRSSALNLHARADLLEAALQGNVLIRGWGAPYLLRSIRHIPRIRICAPLPYRVRRMRELLDFSDDGRVLGEIARSDHAFGSSLRMSKRPNSAEPWHYDVIMNTAQSPVEQCVEAVVKAAGEAQFQETELSRATLANLALRTRILATLKGAPSTAAARIDAVATQGSVMLLGMVGKAEDVRAIGEAVAAIPGVTTLHNELRPIYEGTRSWRSSASI